MTNWSIQLHQMKFLYDFHDVEHETCSGKWHDFVYQGYDLVKVN